MKLFVRSKPLNNLLLLAASLGLALGLAGCGSSPQTGPVAPTAEAAPAGPAEIAEPTADEEIDTVDLSLHVMSKCPFAVKLEDNLWPVLEQLGDHVNFGLYYIGRTTDEGFESLHGADEVYGDRLQLCANMLGEKEQWIEFIKCQNENWREIPAGWEECSVRAGLDPETMFGCVEDNTTDYALTASFAFSLEYKASGSPTIFIDDEPYTGGRSSRSLARHLCSRLNAEQIPYCNEIPPPVEIDVTIISDRRCQGRGCDPARFVSFLSVTFEGARIRELDYFDNEAQALFSKSGAQHLPIAIFSPELRQERTGFERLQKRIETFGDNEGYYYPLGRDWDPTAEICDDGVDNTGNGRVDCKDKSCKNTQACREEQKGRLELFVMSQCPYGVRTVDATLPVLEHFDKNRRHLDFKIVFVGNDKDGELTSMHGDAEVEEDKRQLCAQKHYRKNYKFMEYVLCRNADYRSENWKECAKDGIKPVVIDKCANGPEGRKLLKASFRKAADLKISASPTWLLNNRLEMEGRNPADIKNAFCAENSDLEACQRELADTEVAETKPTPSSDCAN